MINLAHTTFMNGYYTAKNILKAVLPKRIDIEKEIRLGRQYIYDGTINPIDMDEIDIIDMHDVTIRSKILDSNMSIVLNNKDVGKFIIFQDTCYIVMYDNIEVDPRTFIDITKYFARYRIVMYSDTLNIGGFFNQFIDHNVISISQQIR